MEVPDNIRQALRKQVDARTGDAVARQAGLDRVTLYRAMGGRASRTTLDKLQQLQQVPPPKNLGRINASL